MKKSATTTMKPAGDASTAVRAVRDAADALYRAATECCRQHDRVSRIVGQSDLDQELLEAQKACETCDDSLGTLAKHYEETSASVHPTGPDERWWRDANSLWLASKEYLRRHRGCDAASRQLANHGPEQLEALHAEYELEASALLALQQAAEAYKRDRPIAA